MNNIVLLLNLTVFLYDTGYWDKFLV